MSPNRNAPATSTACMTSKHQRQSTRSATCLGWSRGGCIERTEAPSLAWLLVQDWMLNTMEGVIT